MPLTQNRIPHIEEMRRRIAGCRERLRRTRTTQKMAPQSAAPGIDSLDEGATEELEMFDSSARMARGEEIEREH